mmetsp:Transcript_19924/g.46673  ORF Transcript_19924/g.46673 Transcript_19924/m.46673 type:complete len:329 (+) Transcript_19924:65-1051(+)
MDDLLHGLSLLGPRIEQMSAQLEKVSQEVAEHRNLLTLKAEQADIGQMRSQLGSLGHGLAQKVDQLDRETSEFMTTAMQKITRIGEQLENKAASGRLDQLEERLSKVLQGIERKAEDMALRRLEEQVIVLGEGVEGKAERNELQKAQEKLQELANAMDPKAEKSDLEPLRKRLEEHQITKVDSSLVEQLMSKVRTLTTSMTEKAEFAELEQVKLQVNALNGSAAESKESSTKESEAVQAKFSAMTRAVGRCVSAEELQRSVEDLTAEIDKKADSSKIDLLVSQVEILSDVITPKLKRGAGGRPGTAKKKGFGKAETTAPPEHASRETQ